MTGLPRSNYIDETKMPYHFCPGCGHGVILDQLNQAMVRLQLDPRKVVIVTDIGCAGLSDKYFDTNAFHGLHGRSVTYATGMKMANPDLEVIVLIGDGGCGIGGHHLISAARRNIGLTVLVFNNLNYGMTGGEHSVTTPFGAKTATTSYGNLERPLDICQTVTVNGASFVARTTSFEKKLPLYIEEAISNDGFSLIDIWELCTAYYVPQNKFSRKALEETLTKLEFPIGVIHQQTRVEYSRAYRAAVADQRSIPLKGYAPVVPKYKSPLSSLKQAVIAGRAGAKTITAATIFSKGALLSGLWVSQRNDYPVTVKTGYSLSEVLLSPYEILYTGLTKPDFMLVLFEEGLKKVLPLITALSKDSSLYINADLLPVETRATVVPLDFSQAGRKKFWSIIGLAEVLHYSKLYPLEALRGAISSQQDFAGEYMAVYDAWKLRRGV